MADQICRFKLDDNCHTPKKGHFVCKSCWSSADDHQKEMLKAHQEGYCTVVGCWSWAGDGAKVCDEHNKCTMQAAVVTTETRTEVKKVQAAVVMKLEAQQAEKVARWRRRKQEGQGSSDSSKVQKTAQDSKAARISAALKDLSTPEVQILAENCIRELASRAVR